MENELQLWQTIRFSTDPRDHWSHNGILPCIVKWRELPFNSILWVSSESHSRQSWMTEFSLDLIGVSRSQRQMTTFALCNRPQRVRWTPETLLKQLICRFLHLNPALAIEEPELFNGRVVRRASNFASKFRLLESIIAGLDSLLILIDRMDLCQRDSNSTDGQNVLQVYSKLAKNYKTFKFIIMSSGSVDTEGLSRLGVSLAIINTRRRPHRRYDDTKAARDRED